MRQPWISLLVPFRPSANSPHRTRLWEWLERYWSYELPEAEIVIGRSYSKTFSKTEAVNDAAQRAKGRIFVILDSDAYLRGDDILRCARAIEKAARRGQNRWFIPYRRLYRLTEVSTELVLRSNPGWPFRFPSPPAADDVESMATAVYGHHFGAMVQIMPREAFEMVGHMDGRFCVDQETEIFTQDGWKQYQDLSVGDVALTLSHELGISEWQLVQAVNVFPAQETQMLSMESPIHSSLTTLNHRWPVLRRTPRLGRLDEVERGWATSETLVSGNELLVATHQDSSVMAERIPSDEERRLVLYFGVTWCPTTQNGTWLARRHDTTWFTGNSGWGGEDVAFVRAVDTIFGKHKTLNADVLHLWHPSIGTNATNKMWEGQNRPGSNGHLATRYHKATGDRVRMRTLVDEGRPSLLQRFKHVVLWALAAVGRFLGR